MRVWENRRRAYLDLDRHRRAGGGARGVLRRAGASQATTHHADATGRDPRGHRTRSETPGQGRLPRRRLHLSFRRFRHGAGPQAAESAHPGRVAGRHHARRCRTCCRPGCPCRAGGNPAGTGGASGGRPHRGRRPTGGRGRRIGAPRFDPPRGHRRPAARPAGSGGHRGGAGRRAGAGSRGTAGRGSGGRAGQPGPAGSDRHRARAGGPPGTGSRARAGRIASRPDPGSARGSGRSSRRDRPRAGPAVPAEGPAVPVAERIRPVALGAARRRDAGRGFLDRRRGHAVDGRSRVRGGDGDHRAVAHRGRRARGGRCRLRPVPVAPSARRRRPGRRFRVRPRSVHPGTAP